MIRNFLASITRNGISLLGTALALAGLVLIICLFVIEKLGYTVDAHTAFQSTSRFDSDVVLRPA